MTKSLSAPIYGQLFWSTIIYILDFIEVQADGVSYSSMMNDDHGWSYRPPFYMEVKYDTRDIWQ